MEIFEKNKKILLFIGIFVAVILVYLFFFSGDQSDSASGGARSGGTSLVSEVSISPADAIVGRELLLILTKLQSISLDTSIFTSPLFLSLKDWSRPIDPQPFGKALGRRNPFADFVKGSLPVSTTTAVRSSPAAGGASTGGTR